MQLITQNIVLCAKKTFVYFISDFLQKLKNLVKCAASKPSNCSSLGRMLIFMCWYQTAAVLCELDVDLICGLTPYPTPVCCDQTDSRTTVNRCQINFYGIMNILRRHDTAGPTMAAPISSEFTLSNEFTGGPQLRRCHFVQKQIKTFQTPSKIN